MMTVINTSTRTKEIMQSSLTQVKGCKLYLTYVFTLFKYNLRSQKFIVTDTKIFLIGLSRYTFATKLLPTLGLRSWPNYTNKQLEQQWIMLTKYGLSIQQIEQVHRINLLHNNYFVVCVSSTYHKLNIAVTPDQTMNPQHMHQNYQMLFRFF